MKTEQKYRRLTRVAMFLAPLVITPQVAAQNTERGTLSFYCSNSKLSYQESTVVGQPVVVKSLHGPYLQVSSYSDDPAVLSAFSQAGVGAGVDEACMHYLLSASSSQSGETEKLMARVNFHFDRSDLDSESIYILDQLRNKLGKGTDDLVVEGYTDSSGSEDYNFSLGLKRTQTVMNYLSGTQAHLKGKSYGEGRLVNDESSAEERRANRRVEIYKPAE